jgi:type I restriction enzyme M protein
MGDQLSLLDAAKPAAETSMTEPEIQTLEEGKILDYITNKPVKETAKEQVRQRIARALFHEYGISVDDMVPDFKMRVDGRNKKVDIAIFEPNAEKTLENIRRVVVCDKEPKQGKKGAMKMRDHEQAKKDVAGLQAIMRAADECEYGLWTNGLEFFFFEKEVTRFDVKFKPLGGWPMGDDTLGSRDVASTARMRPASAEGLRIAFRRCHNFLYLIFATMYDEKRSAEHRQFWAGPTEQFEPEGREAIRARIEPLFEEVKKEFGHIFRGNEEIELSDRALAFMVYELAKYNLGRTDVDAKGAAYQEIVGTNLRGDRGQYFTPRGAIKLVVDMLDPKPHERIMDPACGTGGFLVAALDHINRRLLAEAEVDVDDASTESLLSLHAKLADFAHNNVFGGDFDQSLVRTAQMNAVMASNAEGNFFHMNSLEFPSGHLDEKAAGERVPFGSVDVVMTNPPFGAAIPITDPNILRHFELAHTWERTDDGAFRNTGRLQGSMSPEVLFIERCVDWLKPGGRMGIVLPDGILGNPGDEYIRWWILRHCWVLASVDLPVEVFIVEANVNILTSLLFLKRKTQEEIQAEDLGADKKYQVFMAVAERVGFDRRGNTVYKRSPDGQDLVGEVIETERIRVGGAEVSRTLRRMQKIVDDDLPQIGREYSIFRTKHTEPGA